MTKYLRYQRFGRTDETYVVDFEGVRLRHPLMEVADGLLDLKIDGLGRQALCPFHVEESPSFKIGKDADHFHCFGCGEHGDVVDLVSRMMGYTKMEAVEYLDGSRPKVDVKLERRQVVRKPENEFTPGEAQALYEALVEDGWAYPSGGMEQGIMERPKAFWLGHEWLKRRGFPDRPRIESGMALVCEENLEVIPDRLRAWLISVIQDVGPLLCVPLRNLVSNRMEGLAFRVITDGKRRKMIFANNGRLADPEGVPRVYGFGGASQRCGTTIVCEGMPDTLSGEYLAAGIDVAVVGATSAQGLVKLAPHLKGTVIVVPHLDAPKGAVMTPGLEPVDGVGQVEARRMLAELPRGTRGYMFDWGRFKFLLEGYGVREVQADGSWKRIADLNDALMMASNCLVDARAAFLECTHGG